MLSTQKFIDAKLQGANNTQAALKAGSKTKQAAHKAGYRLSKRTDIQTDIEKQLRLQGSTIKQDVAILLEAQQATKVITSPTEPDYERPDYTTRIKATIEILKLKGVYNKPPTPSHEDSPEHNWITTLASSEDAELQRIVLKKSKQT